MEQAFGVLLSAETISQNSVLLSEQTYSDHLSTQQRVFDLRLGGLIGGALGAALWTFAPGASGL
ncbi:MAG: hypothetical protein OSB21_12480 [Myxococcota bacterium]|nr:hypothetical protein [Myxococcota bacterium]